MEGAVAAHQDLVDTGFAAPTWEELAGRGGRGSARMPLSMTPKNGWQYVATQPVNARFIEGTVRPRLTDTAHAQLRSQSGPMASVPFTCCPVARHTTFDPEDEASPLTRLWCQPWDIPSCQATERAHMPRIVW